MANTVKIDGLADAVMKELSEYADVIDSDMRKAVTKAGQTVRKDISAGAPRRHGDFIISSLLLTASIRNRSSNPNAL